MSHHHSQFVEVGFRDLDQSKDKFWHLEHQWFSFSAHQGGREYMEDRMHCLCDPDSNFSVFSIFDGHGGEYVSDYLEKHYSSTVRHRILKNTGHTDGDEYAHAIKKAIAFTIHEIDTHIAEKNPAKTADAGSTLCSAVIQNNKYLTVANVGDSRAIASDSQGNCVVLTKDHKPSDVKEKLRVEEAGGVILQYKNDVERVQGILAMTRSVGDATLKPNEVVISVPDVKTYDLSKQQFRYIILASDGLFDVVSNEEAIQMANSYMQAHGTSALSKVANILCTEALRRGSLDNVSVLILKLVL
uniref:PPM-type phosphatase domain-containing protein n=1 Tax=Panagrolaimus sp. PS1159 TaxID=55785 RepID=A0AC35GNP3_9BILA